MITYESICEKIGFDPIKDKYNFVYKGHEDDSQPSPFACLSSEELEFITDYLIAHKEQLTKYIYHIN